MARLFGSCSINSCLAVGNSTLVLILTSLLNATNHNSVLPPSWAWDDGGHSSEDVL